MDEQPEPIDPGSDIVAAQTQVEAPDAAPATLDPVPWLAAGGITLTLGLVAAVLGRRWLLSSAPAIDPAGSFEKRDETTIAPPAPDAAAPAAPTRAVSATLAGWGDVLTRTAQAFRGLFGRPIDESVLSELEDALLASDVGVATTTRLLGAVRAAWKRGDVGPDALRDVLGREMRSLLGTHWGPLQPPATRPWVILVVGVNGSGKTTTIGKLAARFTGEGKRVLVAAADTYRAAAAEQLAVWAERAGADLVRHGEGADPAAVAFDALQAATSRGHDVVLIDTAGRLQTRKPLMEQLSKIRRVIAKVVPDGPHDTLLVVDGTMGQNAVSQARLFHDATPLTGVVVTKLDGTAKGGMVLALAAELGLAVRLVGVGERVVDLRDFDPDAFVASIA